MIKRRAGAAVAVTAVMVLGVAPHGAHAASETYTVRCAGTQAWSFSSPLTEAFMTGTVSTSAKAVCASTYSGSSRLPVYVVDHTDSMAFQGSCVVAAYSNSLYLGSGLLVGGAVAMGGTDNGSALVEVTPLTPCDEGAARGAEQTQYTYTVPIF